MAANSATALASQQSIKAYVDTQITAEDLDFSGDSGTGAVDLDSQTLAISGTASEIKTVASGQSLTISLPDDIIVGNGLTVTGIGSFLNDVNFRGKSGLTSAFWDKSESSLKWNDNVKAQFGDSQDLTIYHDSANSYITEEGTGTLKLTSSGSGIDLQKSQTEYLARFFTDGAVTLYHNNNDKLSTGPAGIIVTGVSTADGFSVGDNEYITAGIGSDLALYHDSTDSWIVGNTGSTIIAADSLLIKDKDNTASLARFTHDGDVKLYSSGTEKLRTDIAGVIIAGVSTADGFSVGDDEKIQVGAGNDLEIYHSSDVNYIQGHNNRNLEIKHGSDIAIQSVNDGALTIYHDGSARVATTSDGADVSGTGSLKVPVGTTAQRNGSPADGDIRYNSTLNSYEGYGNSAWGGLGGGTEIDTSVSSTSATSITTFAHASYRSASIRIQIVQGSAYQVGRYLLIHDGTTVTIVEESAIATGSMLGTITAAIVSTNVVVYVNMGSSSSATVTTIVDKITV